MPVNLNRGQKSTLPLLQTLAIQEHRQSVAVNSCMLAGMSVGLHPDHPLLR